MELVIPYLFMNIEEGRATNLIAYMYVRVKTGGCYCLLNNTSSVTIVQMLNNKYFDIIICYYNIVIHFSFTIPLLLSVLNNYDNSRMN